MDGRNAQVGWTDAQWNRVRQEVLHAWQPHASPVRSCRCTDPSTQHPGRPQRGLKEDGTVDEHQPRCGRDLLTGLAEPPGGYGRGLSSALLQFRRRATQVGQLEDWYIFNGTFPYEKVPEKDVWIDPSLYRPPFAFLEDLKSADVTYAGAPDPLTAPIVQVKGLLARNPGALGLMGGARRIDLERKAVGADGSQRRSMDFVDQLVKQQGKLDIAGLMTAVTGAMSTLADNGYGSPFACVLGRRPFDAAHVPVEGLRHVRPRPARGTPRAEADALQRHRRATRENARIRRPAGLESVAEAGGAHLTGRRSR